jgi:hypothetical protein
MNEDRANESMLVAIREWRETWENEVYEIDAAERCVFSLPGLRRVGAKVYVGDDPEFEDENSQRQWRYYEGP